MRQPGPRVFITVAVTGNLTTPDQTPHLPITPAEIAEACLEGAQAGVKPEIELFDSGDIALLHDLIADKLLDRRRSAPMGVRYGFQVSPETVLYARGLLPEAPFHRDRHRPARVHHGDASYLLGGHVRVGIEDGVYLSRGALAQLAGDGREGRGVARSLGAEIASAAQARELLGLPQRAVA